MPSRKCLLTPLLILIVFSNGVAEEWSEGPIEGDALSLSDDISYASNVINQKTTHNAPAALMSFNIEQNQPRSLYLGTQEVSFSTYRTLISGANTLWIADRDSWRQYTTCPLGSSVSLVATTPSPGYGDLIEIYPSGSTDFQRYWFNTYNYLNFYGDTPGRHILLFVKDDLPSNAIIIDVTGGRYEPPDYAGLALVTVISGSFTGFDVVVDDIYRYRDVDDGVLDGSVSFTVLGNMNHKIVVSKGGYRYSQTRYFAAGRAYTLRIG